MLLVGSGSFGGSGVDYWSFPSQKTLLGVFMLSFGIGLALGLVGLILGVLVWLINMFGEPLAGYKMPFYDFLTTSAAAIGFGGVAVFWIILPIKRLVSKRRKAKKS